ncbi:DNA-directed RNA polymerase subunit alpha [Synergistales bacterium]|nr:DNA-directed RNA polymerase subunit alpha [Synergistales bacterium]
MEHARYEIKVEESTPSYGKVVIEPLERGYGVTLGNALRRVLLSSISGAAITAIRVEGVFHEFTTVPGVKEDIIELLMNVKHIPVRSFASEVRLLHLDVTAAEPMAITAANIEPDSDIEFPDPEAVICHIEKGAHLEMDFYVESGVGYAPIDRSKSAYLPVDALLVDAIFSPARRVKYDVQDKRMGQRTDYDSLCVEVWTNGVVKPEDAICQASLILRDYFMNIAYEISPDIAMTSVLAERPLQIPGGELKAYNGPGSNNPDYVRPVRDLELSVRSENCLMRGGVNYIGDLVGRSRGDLMKIRNLGKVSLKEIEEKLTKFGLSLSGEIEEDEEEEN